MTFDYKKIILSKTLSHFMEGKNIVYLVALVVTCLFVVLILAYLPGMGSFFQNANQASNLIEHIENNIDSDNSNDHLKEKSLTQPVTMHSMAAPVDVVKTQPVEQPKPLSKMSQLNSKINQQLHSGSAAADKDPALMLDNIRALVVRRYDGVNENPVDTSIPMMEFTIATPPTIEDYNKDSGGVSKDLNYKLSYWFGSHSGNLNITTNNTVFQPSLAGSGNATIEFRYSDDRYRRDRESMLKHSRQDPRQLAYLEEHYKKETILEQKVSFFMWDVKFNKLLRMPQKLTIWNEYSKDVFPCKLIEHSFVHGGSSYNVDYSCERLPNFNDYGGSLKFIFN